MREPWVQSPGWEDPRRRERLPTPVFWPGEFRGLYSPWAHKESDTTERLPLSLQRQLEAGEASCAPGRGRRASASMISVFPPRSHDCGCRASHRHCGPLCKKRKASSPHLCEKGKVFLEIPRNVDVWLKLSSLPCTEKQERHWWECGEVRQSMDPPQGWNNSFCVQFSFPPFFPVAYVSLTEVLITHSEYQFQWPLCLPPAALGSSLHSLVILIWYFLQFTM